MNCLKILLIKEALYFYLVPQWYRNLVQFFVEVLYYGGVRIAELNFHIFAFSSAIH